MTTNRQKIQERAVLDRYLQLTGPVKSIEAGERPDFILVCEGMRIGVEIMEYTQPKGSKDAYPRVQVEREWEELREAACSASEKDPSLVGIGVYLTFLALRVPGSSERAAFVTAVFELARMHLAPTGTKRVQVKITQAHNMILRKYLGCIEFRRTRGYRDWDWNFTVTRVGTSQDELLSIMRKKLELTPATPVDELHLVLAGDGPTGGTYIGRLGPTSVDDWPQLRAALSESAFSSCAILSYDRAWIWRRSSGWRCQRLS